MASAIFKSFLFALEWRAYAFLITLAFFWVTTGTLVVAALQSLGLQILLLIGHTAWYYLRAHRPAHSVE